MIGTMLHSKSLNLIHLLPLDLSMISIIMGNSFPLI